MEQISVLKIAKENTHLARQKTNAWVVTFSFFGLSFLVVTLKSYIPFAVFICVGVLGRMYSTYLDIVGKHFISEESLHIDFDKQSIRHGNEWLRFKNITQIFYDKKIRLDNENSGKNTFIVKTAKKQKEYKILLESTEEKRIFLDTMARLEKAITPF